MPQLIPMSSVGGERKDMAGKTRIPSVTNASVADTSGQFAGFRGSQAC